MRAFIVLTFAEVIFTVPSFALSAECKWVATIGRSIDEIRQVVTKRSGREPNLSCGAGSDFTVCHSCTSRLSEEQWNRVQYMLAEPSFRRWHSTWHIGSFEAQRNATTPGMSLKEILGENFLYAHREFIRSVQANLAAMNLPCITPWTELPRADDPVWPTYEVVKVKAKGICKEKPELVGKVGNFEREMDAQLQEIRLEQSKARSEAEKIRDSEKLFQVLDEIWANEESKVRELEDALLKRLNLTEEIVEELRDCPTPEFLRRVQEQHSKAVQKVAKTSKPEFLRAHKLGEVGDRIDRDWHGELHAYYNDDQPAQCSADPSLPPCDDMGDANSSHVNIHFYKIHGLVDEHVDRWLKTHGYEIASKDCSGKEKCYQWKGTYLGEVPDFANGSGCTLVHTRSGQREHSPASAPASAVQ